MAIKYSAVLPAWRTYMASWVDALTAAGLSSQTIKSRQYKLAHLASLLPAGPDDVTCDQIVHTFGMQDWRPETRKAYRAVAVSFFTFLHDSGLRRDNPSEGLPSVKRPHAHPRPCPEAAVTRAFSEARGTDLLMLRLAAECGLRRAEIASVHSDDVIADGDSWQLLVHGKGDKQRLVPLPDDLARTLLDLHGWMLPGRWTGHVEESYVGKHLSRLLPPGFSAHTLRHRYATAVYAGSHDLLAVSKLLGHESVETTQTYVALPSSRLRDVSQAARIVA